MTTRYSIIPDKPATWVDVQIDRLECMVARAEAWAEARYGACVACVAVLILVTVLTA